MFGRRSVGDGGALGSLFGSLNRVVFLDGAPSQIAGRMREMARRMWDGRDGRLLLLLSTLPVSGRLSMFLQFFLSLAMRWRPLEHTQVVWSSTTAWVVPALLGADTMVGHSDRESEGGRPAGSHRNWCILC